MKYKLVPVNPTPEMIHAGQMAVSGFPRDVLERWEGMLAAAPDVEQEPVARIISQPRFCGKFTDDKKIAEYWESEEQGCTAPLFLHPQQAPESAELVEALQSLLDMQDENCRYDHQGYCQNHNLDHVDEGCRVAKARYTLTVHQKGGDV